MVVEPVVSRLIWHRINLVLVVFCLTLLLMWSVGSSVVGWSYVFMATRADAGFARIGTDAAVRWAASIVVLATMWVPVALTLLVSLHRARGRPDRMRQRVRHAWLACLAFVVVGSAYVYVNYRV